MILEVLSFWQVIVACLVIMLILPIIFYLGSFDKRPPHIRKKPVGPAREAQVAGGYQRPQKQRPEQVGPQRQRPEQVGPGDQGPEEQEPEKEA